MAERRASRFRPAFADCLATSLAARSASELTSCASTRARAHARAQNTHGIRFVFAMWTGYSTVHPSHTQRTHLAFFSAFCRSLCCFIDSLSAAFLRSFSSTGLSFRSNASRAAAFS